MSRHPTPHGHPQVLHQYLSADMAKWEAPYNQLKEEEKGQTWTMNGLAHSFVSTKQKQALTTLSTCLENTAVGGNSPVISTFAVRG